MSEESKIPYPVIDMEATGVRLRELRQARGISAMEVSRYLGLTGQYAIYRWEKGISLPSLDNLFALSQYYGVPMEELLVPKEPIG